MIKIRSKNKENIVISEVLIEVYKRVKGEKYLAHSIIICVILK